MERTIYDHQLPPENDPDVVALSSRWIAEARAAQRPWRALAYAVPSFGIGVVMWGLLHRLGALSVSWASLMAAAITMGILFGRPCRIFGALFDRHWAVIIGVLAFAMSTTGDLYGATLFIDQDEGARWVDLVSEITAADLLRFVSERAPIDWVIATFTGLSAGLISRPVPDARQLVAQACVEVAAERLDAAEQGAPEDD